TPHVSIDIFAHVLEHTGRQATARVELRQNAVGGFACGGSNRPMQSWSRDAWEIAGVDRFGNGHDSLYGVQSASRDSRAERTHVSKSSSLNGLARYPITPAWYARLRSLSSGNAVIKMVGMTLPDATKRL